MADRLQVTVVEARDLREKDLNNKNNSFVQLYLVNKKRHRVKTKIIEKSNDPEWNDKFVFAHYKGQNILYVNVYNANSDINEIIGSFKINLRVLYKKGHIDEWFHIPPKVGLACDGQVHLVLNYEKFQVYNTLVISIQQLVEYDNAHHLPDTKLRERDREQLKESFSSVNTAIDTIRQQCSEYIVSDSDLRDRLRNEGKQLIIDMYKRYYDKFAHKDFTKHREKYIRYEPRALELIIENFFEQHL